MAFASGAQRGAAYVKESDYGVTPSNPTTKTLRNTGMNLSLTRNALDSEERLGDRQVHVSRTGTKQVSGDIPIELVYGDFDDLLAAVMCSDWDNDKLKIGTDIASFTIEDRFTDIDQFISYTGCVIDQFQLTVTPGDTGALVTGSFSVIGADQSISGTALATPTPASTNIAFDTCDGTIEVDDVESAIVNSIDFTIANNTAADYVIGKCSAANITNGRADVTGNITVYLEDDSYISKFVDEDDVKIKLTLKDLDGNKLIFTFPKVRLTSGAPDNDDQSVNVSLDFRAMYDSGDDSTMLIERVDHT